MSLPLDLSGLDPGILGKLVTGHARVKLREGTPPRIEFLGRTPFHVVEGLDSTPRFPRFGSNGGCFKSPAYNDKAVEEMDACFIEREWEDFVKCYLSHTTALLETQARKTPELKELTCQKRTDEEWLMYPPTCKLGNKIMKLAGSRYRFYDVADIRESGAKEMRPDVVSYPDTAQARAAFEYLGESSSDERRRKFLAYCAWSWMVLFIECKRSEKNAAYHFSTPGFLRNTKEGEVSRAQIAKYAAEIQFRQHRTHLFSLYICDTKVRAQRWDRSGCTVTKPLDLKKDGRKFMDFLYRFGQLSEAQVGYDSTVKLATKIEIAKVLRYKSDNLILVQYRDFMAHSLNEYPIFKMQVKPLTAEVNNTRRSTRSSSKEKIFLIGQPVSGHCSPIGRCTKAYVGLDLQTNQLAFIKDSWRPNAPGVRPEVETYARLHEHNVSYVATAIAGGDVDIPGDGPQRTQTDKHLPESARQSERIHTRLVTKEVGIPLDSYPTARDLIDLLYQALVGHWEAYEIAGMLHRDVTPANILIDVESIGKKLKSFMNDWDVCRYKEDMHPDVPHLPGRSGTWPYLSALVLQYPKKPHELADDLEAFIYILVCMALRYHEHKRTPAYPKDIGRDEARAMNKQNKALASLVHSIFFDEYPAQGGYWSGGDRKMRDIQAGISPVDLKPTKSGPTPLGILLDGLYSLLKRHYDAINMKDLERFKVLALENDDEGESQTTASDEGEEEGEDALPVARLFDAEPPEAERTPSARSSPASPAASTLTPRTKKLERTLDNHRPLASLFRKILQENPRAKFVKMSKTADQHDGLKEYVSQDQKEQTGAGSRSSQTRKRKMLEAEYDGRFEEVWRGDAKKVKMDLAWRGPKPVV